MPGARAADPIFTKSHPLYQGSPNYSYTGDGLDYRQYTAPPDQLRDWDPNISGKFGGNGVDLNYTQGNFQAKRGDLGAGFTDIAAGQNFGSRAIGNNTVEQDMIYALIGASIEQYIQNSALLWILSVIGIIVWIITIGLIFQLAFPQYVPAQLAKMPAWIRLQRIDVKWWIILTILLTSLVGLNFPDGQNVLMMLLGVLLIIWFSIQWVQRRRQWITLAVGIILLFSGAIRQYIDYADSAYMSTIMRWPSALCCILLIVDIFYVTPKFGGGA